MYLYPYNPFRLTPLAPEVTTLAEALADVPAGTVTSMRGTASGLDSDGLIDICLAFPDRAAAEAYRDRHGRTFITSGTVTCWVTYASEWLEEAGYALHLAADLFPRR